MSIKSSLRCGLQQLRGARAAFRAVQGWRQERPIAHRDWENILWAHCATNGHFTDLLNPVLRAINPPRRPVDATGLLGRFTVADQKHIATQIARDGYYIFDTLMPEDICAGIERFARTQPAYMEDEFGVADRPVPYDPAHPMARLYKFREGDVVASGAVQSIMADDAFLRIAESYLKTAAIIGGIDSWWSAPYGNGPSSQAAQLYHFDFDAPPRWLKLFVYVTPVGPENGPHVFVKGSHQARLSRAQEIVSRGYTRIADDNIAQAYGNEAAVEIIGPRGTVFLADTRGFHKGKHPTGGDRLICQLLYCSPVFNNHSQRPQHSARFQPDLAAAVQKNPSSYQRYL